MSDVIILPLTGCYQSLIVSLVNKPAVRVMAGDSENTENEKTVQFLSRKGELSWNPSLKMQDFCGKS
jgi:hypothetical protein